MGKKVKTYFEESLCKNMKSYNQYFDRLLELAISMFEWKNLPESIDARYLETRLFMNGRVVFFKDDELTSNYLSTKEQPSSGTYLCLDCAPRGNFDVYGNPVQTRAYSSYNHYQKNLTNEDSVIIWNNYLRRACNLDIRLFATRLYNLDRIIDVNANAQKTPVLIQGDEKQILSLKNTYVAYDGNQPVIFANNNLDVNGIKVLKTDAPYVSDKIYQLKTQIWNEALTYLGISNLNVQKKERLVSDEVSRNMGGVIASRYSRLNARREAVDKINRMFGLNIEVDYREDYREMDDETMYALDTEGNQVTQMVIDERTRG